jgi:CDP-paratose synthetase
VFSKRDDYLLQCTVNEKDIISTFNPTIVLHLASLVSSKNDIETAMSLVESNIVFGVKLLDSLEKCSKIKFFMNFGTFAEYKGGINKIENAYLYSATKTAFKSLLDYYANSFSIKVINIIPYTIYGTIDRIPKIIDHVYNSFYCDKGAKMTLGYQVLDFIHVEDVVEIIFYILETNFEAWDVQTELFLGTGKGHSIRDLAELFAKSLSKPINIDWGALPYRKGDIMYAVGNINKLIELNCVPKINLEAGIELYVRNKQL